MHLKPAMTLKARITNIKEVEEGVSVSYGRRFQTAGKTKIATVPVGYADGYSRVLSNQAQAIVHGKICNLIGNICMDLCVVDVTGVKCAVGDEVVIFENNSDILRLASLSSTINYEIVCSVKNRVPRRYI
jgi:alanine racemase